MSHLERIKYKLTNIKYYFLHRFIWKSHIINVNGMTPGEYYETDEKMFQVLTQLFEEYVNKQMVPIFTNYDSGLVLYTFGKYETGLSEKYTEYCDGGMYLHRKYWEQELPWLALSYERYALELELEERTMTVEEKRWFEEHLEFHKKIQDIYVRIQIRKSRKDAYEVDYTGPEFIDETGNTTSKMFDGHHMNKFHPDYSNYLDVCGKREEQYKKDDDDLMNDIISVRHQLWT